MEVIPNEVVLDIFSFLPWRSLVTCRRVCSHWKQLCDDDTLWIRFWKLQNLTQNDPHLNNYINNLSTSREKFLTLTSLYKNWKEGRFQRYLSKDLSAILCLKNTKEICFLGAQNTSIKVCNLSKTIDQFNGPKSQLAKDQPINNLPAEKQEVIKYIPPHQRKPGETNSNTIQVNNNNEIITENSLPLHFEIDLKGHMDSVTALMFDDNKNYLYSGSNDSTIRVWKIDEDKNHEISLISHLRGHNRSIRIFDQYLHFLASGSKDSTVRIWDTNELKEIQTIQMEGAVYSLQFSDGIVACGDSLGLLCLTDIEAQRERFRFTASGKWLTSIRFDVSSNLVVAAGSDGRTRLFDIRTGGQIGAIYDARNHRSSIDCISLDVSRNLLITGGASISGYDIRSTVEHQPLFQFSDTAWTNVLSLNGTRLVSACTDGTVGIHDTSLVEPRTLFKLRVGKKAVLSLHADETKIIAGTWDGYCQIFNFCHRC